MIKVTLKNKKKNYGFSLIEVLIACAIITTSIFALISTAQKGISLSNQALRATQASFLAEEGSEAVKSIRDGSWATISALSLNTTYYITYNTSTNTWSLSTTPTAAIDSIFTRTVTFSQVLRDSNDDIAATGTADSRTKKVTVVVSWVSSDGSTISQTVPFYLADIFT